MISEGYVEAECEGGSIEIGMFKDNKSHGKNRNLMMMGIYMRRRLKREQVYGKGNGGMYV